MSVAQNPEHTEGARTFLVLGPSRASIRVRAITAAFMTPEIKYDD